MSASPLKCSARKTRIFVVDDHPMMREGLRARIESTSRFEVCGEAAGFHEALQSILESCPDVVILDVNLEDGNGIDLIKELQSKVPGIKILVLSAFQESLYAERALRAGALGYLNKQESSGKVLEAIDSILADKRYISEEMTQLLLSRAVGDRSENQESPLSRLSDRELEVFQLIGRGLSTGEIASQLFLSVHTIDTYREKLKQKLKLKNGAELNRYAIQWAFEQP